MRCFFTRDGNIVGVEPLKTTSDADRIAESAALFENKGKLRGATGFEVWDGARLIHRSQEDTAP
jgi:hypothetical protein